MEPGIWIGSRSQLLRSTSRGMTTFLCGRQRKQESRVRGLDRFRHVYERPLLQIIHKRRPIAPGRNLPGKMPRTEVFVVAEGAGETDQQRSAQCRALQHVGYSQPRRFRAVNGRWRDGNLPDADIRAVQNEAIV